MPKDIGKEMMPKMVTLGAIGRISLAVSEENLEAKHATERDLIKYYLFAINEEITSNFIGT